MMRLRRFVLTGCILLSSTLFVCGLLLLCYTNIDARTKPELRKEPVHPEQMNSPNTEIVGEEKKDPVDRKEPAASKEEPVNIVIFGLDEEQVRSDVIALINFDPDSGGMNILSIARDTKVRVGGRSSKINAMIGIGGERLAIQKIEELTGLQITYYVTLNFKGFKKMVDTLDGVELYVPINMDYDDPDQNLHIHLKKGTQVLDGEKAEQFVRYRKGNAPGQGYTDGDIGRIKMQQEFIKALITQKFKLKYLSKADDIYFILKKYVKTNIEIGDVDYYLKSIMNVKYTNLNTFTLPGDSAYIDELWYFICDRKKTRDLITEHFY